jgi:hypothetical protein
MIAMHTAEVAADRRPPEMNDTARITAATTYQGCRP